MPSTRYMLHAPLEGSYLWGEAEFNCGNVLGVGYLLQEQRDLGRNYTLKGWKPLHGEHVPEMRRQALSVIM